MYLGRVASIISAMVLWAGGGDGMDSIAREMAGNASVKAAVGALGSHYPGSKGTTPVDLGSLGVGLGAGFLFDCVSVDRLFD